MIYGIGHIKRSVHTIQLQSTIERSSQERYRQVRPKCTRICSKQENRRKQTCILSQRRNHLFQTLSIRLLVIQMATLKQLVEHGFPATSSCSSQGRFFPCQQTWFIKKDATVRVANSCRSLILTHLQVAMILMASSDLATSHMAHLTNKVSLTTAFSKHQGAPTWGGACHPKE